MTVRKGIYRVLACPCGFSALQQEENPKLYKCDHCGRVRTLDGSPPPLGFAPLVGDDGTFFQDVKDWEAWHERETVKCALPPEMIGVKPPENS